MSALDRVHQALESVGSKRHGDNFSCPGHDDSTPSLSVSEGRDGRVLVKCRAGCTVNEVLEALGLEIGDLFEQSRAGEWTPRGDAVAIYDYTDESGGLLFQVCRTADKQSRSWDRASSTKRPVKAADVAQGSRTTRARLRPTRAPLIGGATDEGDAG